MGFIIIEELGRVITALQSAAPLVKGIFSALRDESWEAQRRRALAAEAGEAIGAHGHSSDQYVGAP